MPNRRYSISWILLLGMVVAGYQQPLRAAELSTLFTTPSERQIINSNRYRDDEPKPVETEEVRIELPIQQLAREEVVQKFRVSGIALSPDGQHSVWINSVLYADGERLEDNSKVEVLVGDEVRVRITAPDGKRYYATSGQTLEISYLVTIQN